MIDAGEEKQAILKQLEYSVEISNPLGGMFWDNMEQPLGGAITSFMSIGNGLTAKINEYRIL